MVHSRVRAIDEAVQNTYVWLRDISSELGGERREAYTALRGVLHAIRDRISVDESAQLAAQLPLLVRGIYFEGWDPQWSPPSDRNAANFLDEVMRETGFEEADAEWAIESVARVIQAHVSPGEWADVVAQLPPRLRQLLATAV